MDKAFVIEDGSQVKTTLQEGDSHVATLVNPGGREISVLFSHAARR